MPYFSTMRGFLLPSIEPMAQDVDALTRFLLLLEESGVGGIIAGKAGGRGRPPTGGCLLFPAILLAFSERRYTLRQIELAIRNDIRYLWLTQQTAADHTTIGRFIKGVVVPNRRAIFAAITKAAMKELGVEAWDAFLDGTK